MKNKKNNIFLDNKLFYGIVKFCWNKMINSKLLSCQEMQAANSLLLSSFIWENNPLSNCDQRQLKFLVYNERILKKSIGKHKTKKGDKT